MITYFQFSLVNSIEASDAHIINVCCVTLITAPLIHDRLKNAASVILIKKRWGLLDMISVCEKYAEEFSIMFSPGKSNVFFHDMSTNITPNYVIKSKKLLNLKNRLVTN